MSYTDRLADELAEIGRIRVRLDDLIAAWHRVAPELVGRHDRFAVLAEQIDVLAEAGVIEVPAKRSWDRSYTPALPNFVTVPAARRQPKVRSWQSFPWRPELAWAVEVPSMSEQQFEWLQALNRWLNRSDRSEQVVPMRLRSAEVFGDEKALDLLLQTALFGPGRLSFELLACRRRPTPLPAVQVGSGADVLVVENVDSFWACVDVLRAEPGSKVGWAVWGHGNEFSSGAAVLGEQFPEAEVIWYWGDLDPEGVRIAGRAHVVDERVRPHLALWSALAELPAAGQGLSDWEQVPESWLGEELWALTAAVRSAGGRVAQERLSVNPIAARLRR